MATNPGDGGVEEKEFAIDSICGACEKTLAYDNIVVALHSTDDRTACSGVVSQACKYQFSDQIVWQESAGGTSLGYTTWSRTALPIVVAVHEECFWTFLAGHEGGPQDTDFESIKPEALDRLWTIGAWREAWFFGDEVGQKADGPMSYSNTELIAFNHIAAGIGLPQLAESLPLEILDMVYRQCSDAPLWSCVPVLVLGMCAARQRDQPLQRTSLGQIKAWKRPKLQLGTVIDTVPGTALASSEPSAAIPSQPSPLMQPVVRITVDRRGVYEIQRLLERPAVDSHSTADHMMYIVEHMQETVVLGFSELLVEIKNGLARLRFPQRFDNLYAWNTPSPPETAICKIAALSPPRSLSPIIRDCEPPSRFYALDTSPCSGVSFAYNHHGFCRAHVHRSENDRIRTPLEPNIVQVYLPIAPNDRITAIWACAPDNELSSANLVLRLELAGDVFVGSEIAEYLNSPPSSCNSTLLAHGSRIGLFYGYHHGDIVFGAYALDLAHAGADKRNDGSHGIPQLHNPKVVPKLAYLPPDLFHINRVMAYWDNRGYIFMSSAPLARIQSVRIFPCRKFTDGCCGLLIQYTNGGIRALGRCNPLDAGDVYQMEDSFSVDAPDLICCRMFGLGAGDETPFHGVDVAASRADEHSHDEGGWLCNEVGHGMLYFYHDRFGRHSMVYRPD